MTSQSPLHSHVFLSEGHESNERRTWAVIALCGAMMLAEIVGGLLFGSIALVADGLHMSTHAGAMLLAALAYSYSRKHADDRRFTFGTGKLVGLVLARVFGWLWMDPLAGIVGAFVIASWSYGLIRAMPEDTANDAALRTLASRISLAVALVLVGVKFTRGGHLADCIDARSPHTSGPG